MGLATVFLAALGLGGCGGDPSSDSSRDEARPIPGAELEQVPEPHSSAFDAARLARIESSIEEAIVQYSIPGTAVAIVEGPRIVYSRGMGLRHVRRRHLVTQETLFRVGAVTRPMTATLMATLADENRLEWPELESWARSPHSGLAWERTFIRDAFEAASVSAGENSSRRSAYRLSMQNRVFGPAGMMRSAITDRLPAMSDDYATPYATDLEGRLVEGEFPEAGDSAPIDGAASTAEDLGRFLILYLEEGIAQDGNRVASDSNLARASHVRPELDRVDCVDRPLASRCGYAFGWHLSELADASHWLAAEGGREGFSALVGYLEGRGIGLVILANLEASLGGLAYARQVRDAFLIELLQLPPPDNNVHLGRHADQRQRLKDLANEMRPVSQSVVRAFVGRYAEGWSVALTAGRLELRQELRSFPIEARAGGGYLIAQGPRVGSPVRFDVGPEGPGMWLTNHRGQPERFPKLD